MDNYQDFNNPFSDPFTDSSIKEATQNKEVHGEDPYNPFSDPPANTHSTSAGTASNNTSAAQPLNPNLAATRSFNYGSGPTTAELQKRQEELDRKAEELRQREEAMQRNLSVSESRNNFPPIPSFCPIKSCFYQDIEAEIPVQHQRLVTLIFYFWAGYNLLLIWNVVICMTYFVISIEYSLRNHSAVNFTLSLLNFIIFCPASYVFWFRPVYKAFKFDSSINFFIFFFVFFMQFVTAVVQSLAIDGWGFVGILNSMDMFTAGHASASVVGVFMFLTGVLFAMSAGVVMVLLIKVHQVYRTTGGSLAKAHMELTTDVKSGRVMQEAAGNIAESAVSQALLGPRRN